MEMKYRAENRQLTIQLCGELDHHAAKAIMEGMDRCMEQNLPSKTILDLGGLTFMDSSGIGVVLGRYKTLSRRGGTVAVRQPTPHVNQIFRMSGLYQIVEKL